MNMQTPPGARARQAAEEVLQAIYGDDFVGCTISVDTVAAIVDSAVKDEARTAYELVDVLNKVLEAVHVLSTPPSPAEVKDSQQLQEVLGKRLDAIREISTKTINAIAELPIDKPQN
jgi:hypothetical protein